MLGIIYELRLHCLDPIRDHYLIMEENQAQVGEVFWTPSYPGVTQVFQQRFLLPW